MRRFQPSLLSKVNTIVQVVTAIAVLASGVVAAADPDGRVAALRRWRSTTVASGSSVVTSFRAHRREDSSRPNGPAGGQDVGDPRG